MRRLLFLLPAAAAVFLLVSCGPTETREASFGESKRAPSSSLDKSGAIGQAVLWTLARPGLTSYVQVATSASMLPYFDSSTVLLLEVATGRDLRVGDLALFERAGAKPGDPTVCHRVTAVNPETGACLFSGNNNAGVSDGWIPSDRVRWRVAGMLFSRERSER